MKKIPVYEESWQNEEGNTGAYQYYLLVEEVETAHFFCENYGISVKDCAGSEVEIKGITCDKARVESLLEVLRQYKVSPLTVGDVIADWL